MLWVGIDPGISGAIAVLDSKTRNVSFVDTPTVQVKVGKTIKNQMDAHAASLILQALDDTDGIFVAIEKVAPMPSTHAGDKGTGMGVTSAFNFGMGFGTWIGICAASLLPFQLIHPATWKAKLMRDMGKDKDASRVKAMQLYPSSAKDLTRKKDHGRADALLLAHYAMMTGVPENKAPEVVEEPSLF